LHHTDVNTAGLHASATMGLSGRLLFDSSNHGLKREGGGLCRNAQASCVTGGPGGLACLEIWLQGQEPSGAIWALPMWAPRQIEGMRVGGVSTEEATEPHSQRKATAVRSKTHSPAKAEVNHVHVQGESMIDCSQFSKCCKVKQAFTALILQPRGL
jgi:hypothetical protein